MHIENNTNGKRINRRRALKASEVSASVNSEFLKK
jgi:hypothetical protein